MIHSRLAASGLAAALILGTTLAISAQAQDNSVQLDFGDDSAPYANDGECDDPRFSGRAMSDDPLTDYIGKDASDCSAAFRSGRIALNPLFAEPSSPGEYNYGDDRSDFARDGDCDDIRFTGPYAGDMLYLVEDIGHDATDCEKAVLSGIARWQGPVVNPVQNTEY